MQSVGNYCSVLNTQKPTYHHYHSLYCLNFCSQYKKLVSKSGCIIWYFCSWKNRFQFLVHSNNLKSEHKGLSDRGIFDYCFYKLVFVFIFSSCIYGLCALRLRVYKINYCNVILIGGAAVHYLSSRPVRRVARSLRNVVFILYIIFVQNLPPRGHVLKSHSKTIYRTWNLNDYYPFEKIFLITATKRFGFVY